MILKVQDIFLVQIVAPPSDFGSSSFMLDRVQSIGQNIFTPNLYDGGYKSIETKSFWKDLRKIFAIWTDDG